MVGIFVMKDVLTVELYFIAYEHSTENYDVGLPCA